MEATTRTETVMNYLSTDHRRLDGLMNECRQKVSSGDMKGAVATFALFRQGLLRHIHIEEDLVFPEFETATGMSEGGPTGVMRHEHIEIRRILELILDHINGPAPSAAEFESLRAALVAVLHEHNVKEEQILYPMTDRMVPPGRREILVRKMLES